MAQNAPFKSMSCSSSSACFTLHILCLGKKPMNVCISKFMAAFRVILGIIIPSYLTTTYLRSRTNGPTAPASKQDINLSHAGNSDWGQLVTNVTLVDDATDGRLPLGPPLSTNLNKKDQFAPFDLLSGLSIGVVLRPGCASECDREGRLSSNEEFQKSHGKIRLFRMPGNGLSTISYYFNPAEMKSLFVGITTGAGPKSITAQFIYSDDQVEHDVIMFTDAFAGINLHYFGVRHENQRITPHGGIMAAMPRQLQLSAGLDYHLNDSFSVGFEGRYTLCPNREQTFYKNEVIHIMDSACEYRMGLGITAGFTL